MGIPDQMHDTDIGGTNIVVSYMQGRNPTDDNKAKFLVGDAAIGGHLSFDGDDIFMFHPQLSFLGGRWSIRKWC